ncbi:MAG: hypothetical protein JWP89_4415 [Schlesneria sp.]|nr:hypothetical protein [Schlesneria sp.]
MNQDPIDAGKPIAMQSWVWSQHWTEMLFLHWRVDPATIQACLPEPVTVATYDGSAWVSLVLFRLRVRPRWLPFVPWISSLVEVNLRTYVTCNGQPGIWFLSVHANNRPAMALARLLTPLPYEHAAMQYDSIGNQRLFQAEAGSLKPLCDLAFCPSGSQVECRKDSLDEWLLERYRLFIDSDKGLMRAEVAHPRWVVQHVAVEAAVNNFGRNIGLNLLLVPDVAHFSMGVNAHFGPFQPVPLSDSNEPLQRCFPRTEPASESPRPLYQNRLTVHRGA